MGNFRIGLLLAENAIIEMELVFEQPPPQLAPMKLSDVVITDCGNGRWRRTSSYYFNCGANEDRLSPPDEGDTAELTPDDAASLETWFMKRFKDKKPKVLQDGGKWNFTLVYNRNAFNFHVVVAS